MKVRSILSWEVKPGGGDLAGAENPGGAEIWALETIERAMDNKLEKQGGNTFYFLQ